MNEIFSSRVLAVKLDRSKKLSVEMGSDEKKACVGSVAGVGLDAAWRVMRDFNSAVIGVRKHMTIEVAVDACIADLARACPSQG